MKPFAYYAQVPLIPVFFIVAFTQNVYKSVKRSWTNAMIETKHTWEEHERHFAAKELRELLNK